MVLSYASIMILIPGFVNPVFQPRWTGREAGGEAPESAEAGCGVLASASQTA